MRLPGLNHGLILYQPNNFKSIKESVLIPLIAIYSCMSLNAQEIKLPRNNINLYVSPYEYNINYERTMILRPKSSTNPRLGFGLINTSFDGGYYYNPSLVQLFGKNNRHFEADLGFKYLIQKDSPNSFLPDIYAGYRYEKRLNNTFRNY
jgi:hypothetical protein